MFRFHVLLIFSLILVADSHTHSVDLNDTCIDLNFEKLHTGSKIQSSNLIMHFQVILGKKLVLQNVTFQKRGARDFQDTFP